MSLPNWIVDINASGIRVAGVGGLGMVAMAAIVVILFPEGRVLALGGMLGGVALALVLILLGRNRTPAAKEPPVLPLR
jgi:hypothetical protein